MENSGLYCRKCSHEIKDGENYVSLNWHEEKSDGRAITVDYAEEVISLCKDCATPYSPEAIYELLVSPLQLVELR